MDGTNIEIVRLAATRLERERCAKLAEDHGAPAIAAIIRGVDEDTRSYDDSWIGWYGGVAPVPLDTLVDVRLRNGQEALEHHARTLRWNNLGSPFDIVVYRVSSAGRLPSPAQEDAIMDTPITLRWLVDIFTRPSANNPLPAPPPWLRALLHKAGVRRAPR